MTATITAAGAGTTTPILVLGYETKREGRNIVHDLLGGGIAVALVAPRPRSGALELLYESETLAAACVALHSLETTFTLADTDRPSIAMAYVVGPGGVGLALDDETREMWIVTVEYQEIEP